MNTLQVKGGTAASWTKKNSILANREPGFETDTFKLKIGNGILHWKDLPYIDELKSPKADLINGKVPINQLPDFNLEVPFELTNTYTSGLTPDKPYIAGSNGENEVEFEGNFDFFIELPYPNNLPNDFKVSIDTCSANNIYILSTKWGYATSGNHQLVYNGQIIQDKTGFVLGKQKHISFDFYTDDGWTPSGDLGILFTKSISGEDGFGNEPSIEENSVKRWTLSKEQYLNSHAPHSDDQDLSGKEDVGIASQLVNQLTNSLGSAAYLNEEDIMPNIDLSPYAITTNLGDAAFKNIGTSVGTVMAGDTVIPTQYTDGMAVSALTGTLLGYITSVNMVEPDGLGNVQIDPEDVGAEPTISSKGTAFNKDFGTGSGQVMEGNTSLLQLGTTSITALRGDTVIPTTLPASDVYPWAKTSTKPTYTYSDVGAEPTISSKGTAFNKDFGTTAGTVAAGNHPHSGKADLVDGVVPASQLPSYDALYAGIFMPQFAINSATTLSSIHNNAILNCTGSFTITLPANAITGLPIGFNCGIKSKTGTVALASADPLDAPSLNILAGKAAGVWKPVQVGWAAAGGLS